MQNTKQVVLWGLEDLLGRGIESFLGVEQGWNLTSVPRGASMELICEIQRQNPDVVILGKDDHEEDTALTLQLLEKYPKLRVVIVSRKNNSIEIFEKQQIWLEAVSDLLQAVNG